MTPAPPALAVQPRQPIHTNRLLRLAAASVVAVIAGLAAITIRQQDHIADLQAHNRAIMQVITAPDAQLKVAQSAGISASMVSSSDREAAQAISLNTEPVGGSSRPTRDPVLTPTLS
jgi:hypothetical protein